MPKEITEIRTVYRYHELSESAKERVQQWWIDGNEFWAENCIEDFNQILKIIGVSDPDIFYSGFWSQGDGACFIGKYYPEPDAYKKIIEYMPKDEEIHQIVQEIQALQMNAYMEHRDMIGCKIIHSGRYYHENSVSFEFFWIEDHDRNLLDSEEEDRYFEGLTEFFKDLMRWMYKQLEEEYEWRRSDEVVADACESNDYWFEEDGEFYPL